MTKKHDRILSPAAPRIRDADHSKVFILALRYNARDNGSGEEIAMKRTPPKVKRLLLLLSSEGAFRAGKVFFERQGFQVFDRVESADSYNLALMDSFFLHAGMAEYLRQDNPFMPIVLMLSSDEPHYARQREEIYDGLELLEPRWTETLQVLENWFKTPKARMILNQASKEFGSGLWADMIQMMMPVSGPAEVEHRRYA